MIRLTHPLFTVLDHAVSARDLILLLGAVPDLESQQRDPRNHRGHGRRAPHQGAQLRRDRADHAARYYLQSDSVITAVGLSDHLFIMMAAVVIAVGVMMFAARPIGEFVNRHPSVKMLALAFLIPWASR